MMSINRAGKQKDISDEQGPTKIGAVKRFLSVYGNDYRAYLLQKTEKLASALYIVTGFIPHDDPLREKLRRGALDLIGLSAGVTQFNESSAKEFGSRCAEIAALLEAAQYAGLISRMNARLICDEYALLAEFAIAHHIRISGASETPQMDDVTEPKARRFLKGHKGQIKQRSLSDNGISGIGQSEANVRVGKIMDLVARVGTISIKDARYTLQDIGEKTVQRLLLSLVDDGRLEKVGERRWSMYRLPRVPKITSVEIPPAVDGGIENLKNVS